MAERQAVDHGAGVGEAELVCAEHTNSVIGSEILLLLLSTQQPFMNRLPRILFASL